jgi:hypothetical protein
MLIINEYNLILLIIQVCKTKWFLILVGCGHESTKQVNIKSLLAKSSLFREDLGG